MMVAKEVLDYLIEDKAINPSELTDFDCKQAFPEEELLRRGLVSREAVETARAKAIGLEQINHFQVLELEPKFAKRLPLEFLKRELIAPIEELPTHWVFVTARPYQAQLYEEISRVLGKAITVVYCPEKKLLEVLNRKPKSNQVQVSALIGQNSDSDTYVHDLNAQSSHPILSVLNHLLVEAIAFSASDLHIEASCSSLIVRWRVDGLLSKPKRIPCSSVQQFMSRIKVMAKLDVSERRLPQDGRMKLCDAGNLIDCRVSSLPVADGERIVLRFLDRKCLAFKDLGMKKPLLDQFNQMLQVKEGIVFVSGPTGSGKSTTLYSAIEALRSDTLNIMTIEDPIEYKLDSIAQMAVHPKIGLSFARGLRHILRQDPDIIFIGEIRDQETAQIAIQASLTGHLVLSTLHSNDAPSAVTRLLDMGIEPYLIASSLIGVLSQRLVRRMCPNCRRQIDVSVYERRFFPKLKRHYKSYGCSDCHGSGASGRLALYELLSFSKALKQQILEKADAQTLLDCAKQEGFKSLLENAQSFLEDGLCSFEDLLRVSSNQRLVD